MLTQITIGKDMSDEEGIRMPVADGNGSLITVEGDALVYRGFTLDPFQALAISHIDRGSSVIVSAPTGVGKTLIADYLIEKMFRLGHRVVYTAPIKALSNQKFKEFKKLLGPDNVGIITGDVVINSLAPVLIMTTEVFRNILHLSPQDLTGVTHAIFDEIHYLGDEERGTVWEESIIFMPEDMRILGLSATIPNAEELAGWIESVKGHDVKVVRHDKRAVPLKHLVFEREFGEGSLSDYIDFRARQEAEQIMDGTFERRQDEDGIRARRKPTTHRDLVRHLIKGDRLPCLYFIFSRKGCEERAYELSREVDLLDAKEKALVDEVFERRLTGLGLDAMPSVMAMKRAARKGVAWHHAGLLPVLKEVVEELFESRLVKVLYATETFAVGINFPVRTVCFDSMRKFTGVDFRPMTMQEYFQMAGRAGRRGIDEIGYVYVLADADTFRLDDYPTVDAARLEPLKSQFSLSYNTILNLVEGRSPEEIDTVLRHNFASYQNDNQKASVRNQLDKLRSSDSELSGTACPDFGTASCPVYQAYLKEELASEIRRLRRARKHQKEKKAALLLKIQDLKAKLKEGRTVDCPKGKRKECRALLSRRQQLSSRVEELQSRLLTMAPDEKYVREFERKSRVLEALGFLERRRLTPRGMMAKEIHTQELLSTELVFSGMVHSAEVPEIVSLLVCVDYEPRRGEMPIRKVEFDLEAAYEIIGRIVEAEERIQGSSQVKFFTGMADLAYRWSSGAEFPELVKGSGYAEGDIVHSMRRTIDLMRQLRSAGRADEILAEKLRACIASIDRGVVEVVL